MEVLKAIQKAKDVKSKLSTTEKKVSFLGWGESAKDGTFLGETEPWNPSWYLIINTPLPMKPQAGSSSGTVMVPAIRLYEVIFSILWRDVELFPPHP